MKEYILKRLFWMIFTLFGIMVITFCVTRLAPGDPATLKLQGIAQSGSGNQQLSKKLIEDTRKLYGFDKPLLLNFRNENSITFIHKHANRLSDNDSFTKQNAYKTILNLGKVTLPYLTELLCDELYITKHAVILQLVEEISGFSSEKYASLNEKISAWLTYNNNQKIMDISWQKQQIQNLYSNNLSTKTRARENLVSTGTASLFLILNTALSKGIPDGIRLFNLSAEIARKPWYLLSKHDNTKKKNLVKKWKQWWNKEKYKYGDLSRSETFIQIFTNTQFGQWLLMVLTLDFGESYSYHVPVIDLIKERLPISMQLSLISIFLTYIIAIPLGVFSATHQYKLSDKILTVILFILYSLPSFWIANMLILLTTGGDFPQIFPSRYLHSAGADSLPFFEWLIDWGWHLILPVFCLTYASFAYVSRQMRVGMLDIIRQDFIRTARAKGLTERSVIFKHALRNALIPTVTLLAFLLPALLGGSVIIEEIFTINGMGKLSFEAILNRDYPIINAIAFFSAFLTLIGMLLTDIAYVFVDPRISFEK